MEFMSKARVSCFGPVEMNINWNQHGNEHKIYTILEEQISV